MPSIRHFAFVGGMLLALLFAADRYLPAPVETAAVADPDRTIIRIISARSLPEKVVFDTRPRIDVPKVAQAEEPQEQVRQAMAAMPAAPSAEVKKEASTRFAQARPHPKRSTWPSTRAPERRLAFDRHDPFAGGWW